MVCEVSVTTFERAGNTRDVLCYKQAMLGFLGAIRGPDVEYVFYVICL